MSKWIGVVQHSFNTGERIGETLINLDNVRYIVVTKDIVSFVDGTNIKVNRENMKVLLDAIETIGDKA
jgi:hypothetical protein